MICGDSGRRRVIGGFQPRTGLLPENNATGHYHALQIQDFLQAVRDGRPLCHWGDGRRVVELFTAVYRSNKERRPIRFPLAAVNVSAEGGEQ